MSETTVHIIEGNPNAGKTVTAWLVYLQLMQKGEVQFFHLFEGGIKGVPAESETPLREIATYNGENGKPLPYDFCAIIKINQLRVGIFSAGDNDTAIHCAFEWLQQIHADTFVGCCRSHGNASARQALLAHRDDYRFIFHRVYSDYATADFEYAKRDRLPLAEDIAETILSDIEVLPDDKTNIILESIRLKNLWGLYNIEWSLNRHINILTGDNGAGKSTILHTLFTALTNTDPSPSLLEKSNGIDITFNDGSALKTGYINDSYATIREEAKNAETEKLWYSDILKQLTEKVESKYDVSKVKDIMVQTSVNFAYSADRKVINDQKIFSRVKVDLIRTFDAIKNPDKQLVGKNDSWLPSHSELDGLLRLALERFGYYLGKLGGMALQSMREGKVAEETVKVIQNKDAFIALLNQYFNESGKTIVTEDGTLQFKLVDSNKIIDAYALSSGEKQILYTFLTVLFEERQNYILIMDEPEVSLHVTWQRKLIESIKKINPNCQIIMATHSPAIIADGYHSFVTNLEDIRTKTE